LKAIGKRCEALMRQAEKELVELEKKKRNEAEVGARLSTAVSCGLITTLLTQGGGKGARIGESECLMDAQKIYR
jgi:hypothetical protein